MVVCKFFQGGYCRNGANCKFEHVNSNTPQANKGWNGNNQWNRFQSDTSFQSQNQQTRSPFGGQTSQFGQTSFGSTSFGGASSGFGSSVGAASQKAATTDVAAIANEDLFQHPNIYPFSCFSPEKYHSNWIENADLSPEELRWCAYLDVKAHGHIQEYVAFVSLMKDKQNSARQAIAQQLQSGCLQGHQIPTTIVGISVPWLQSDQTVHSNNISSNYAAASNFASPSGNFSTFQPTSSQLNAVSSSTSVQATTVSTLSTNLSYNSPQISHSSAAYQSQSTITDEDRGAYISDTFVFGKIPENAPPSEFCR